MKFSLQTNLPWVFLGLSGTILALAVIAVAGPAWVYAGNADEFASSPAQIFSEYVPYAVGAAAVILALLLLLPAKLARPFALVLAALGVAAYVQGTFLVHDFGPLDGQNWSITMPVWRIALEVFLLFAAILAVWRLGSRAPAIVAALMTMIAVAAVAEPVMRLPQKQGLREVASTSPIFHFSPEKNILIVLLDGMQSELFDEVVQENPEIRSALEGFTYYPDTAGVGYSTALTIPVIHSGHEYDAGKPIKQYFEDTVKNASFMEELAEAGYSTALINPLYGVCPSGLALCTRAKPILTSVQSTISSEANKLLSLGIFRAAPFFLKEFVYNGGKWRQLVSYEDPKTVHFSVEGNTFMEEVAATASLKSAKPTAKFLHLFSTHLPVAVDENCAYVGAQKSTRDGFKQQAKCALSAFGRMMNGLKAKGIYDQTAIILLSDHGSGGWPSSRGIVSNGIPSNLFAVANPTLAIKSIGAAGNMQRDDAPMSLADVPGLVCQLTSNCSKKLANHEQRVRHYRHYKWDGSAWGKNDPIATTTYSISGPVFDGRNWSKAPDLDLVSE